MRNVLTVFLVVLFSWSLLACSQQEEPKPASKPETKTTEAKPSPMPDDQKSAEQVDHANMKETPEEAKTSVAVAETEAGKENAMGQGVYLNFCSSCHDSGVAGAPKTGDKPAWEERIGKGMDALTKNAINGYKGPAGYMPAKGGNMALTDEEVAAAVQHMVEQSQ